MILRFRQFESIVLVDSENIFKSYTSKFINGPHLHIDIFDDSIKVGEIEWGKVDVDTIELISIHIDAKHRGRGYANKSLNLLIDKTGAKSIILKSAPSSKRFWRKMGFTPIMGERDYYKKEIR
jgi:ribosomal protein S18 acetylase RimI-like enzyme